MRGAFVLVASVLAGCSDNSTKPGLGQTCGPTADSCAPGLVCDGFGKPQGTCTTSGANCELCCPTTTGCDNGLRCIPDPTIEIGHCHPISDAGPPDAPIVDAAATDCSVTPDACVPGYCSPSCRFQDPTICSCDGTQCGAPGAGDCGSGGGCNAGYACAVYAPSENGGGGLACCRLP